MVKKKGGGRKGERKGGRGGGRRWEEVGGGGRRWGRWERERTLFYNLRPDLLI